MLPSDGFILEYMYSNVPRIGCFADLSLDVAYLCIPEYLSFGIAEQNLLWKNRKKPSVRWRTVGKKNH
jgi:hypothetical protein